MAFVLSSHRLLGRAGAVRLGARSSPPSQVSGLRNQAFSNASQSLPLHASKSLASARGFSAHGPSWRSQASVVVAPAWAGAGPVESIFARKMSSCVEPEERRTVQNLSSNISLTDTPENVFLEQGSKVLNALQDRLDGEDVQDMQPNMDVEFSDGVLSVQVPGVGTWVLNTHGATRQIWLSSPLSGPNKFNFHQSEGRWLGERDRHSLSARLRREWAQALGFEGEHALDLGLEF